MDLILTDQNFGEELKKTPLPVLVDFYADWCGPCKMMAPVIEDIAKEYEGKLLVGKVDVDANPQLAMKFGIMSIPTIMVFKNGQPVKQLVGYQGREMLLQALALP